MRAVLDRTYNSIAPTRTLTLASTDYTGIQWTNPLVAGATQVALTPNIIADSGISPEFFAALNVLQLHSVYRTVGINSWVYASHTPQRWFFGRTDYLTLTPTIITRD